VTASGGATVPRTLAWWKSKRGTAATPAFVEETAQVTATL